MYLNLCIFWLSIEYKFSLNFSPVTPIFDIPTTESAVQRATTIFQRRRKKILAEVNSLAKNAASSNASKTNQQKKLVRKHLDPKETLVGNGHNVENIEKIKGTQTFFYSWDFLGFLDIDFS